MEQNDSRDVLPEAIQRQVQRQMELEKQLAAALAREQELLRELKRRDEELTASTASGDESRAEPRRRWPWQRRGRHEQR